LYCSTIMHLCSQWIAREMVKTKLRNGRHQENPCICLAWIFVKASHNTTPADEGLTMPRFPFAATSAYFHALLLRCSVSVVISRSTFLFSVERDKWVLLLNGHTLPGSIRWRRDGTLLFGT
jgi:hypothetical protein